MVEAGGVEANAVDPALGEQFGGVARQAGEMEIGGIARRVGAEIGLAVPPVALPAGADQHDRLPGNAAVARLPCRDVGNGEAIVTVFSHRCRHVDHHRRADQPGDRDLVDRLASFGEVDRGVEMGAAMLLAA